MSDEKSEFKIMKLDPLGSRLDKVGMRGGASRGGASRGGASKSYSRFLSKQTKPKIDKAISKKDNKSGFGSLKRRNFKGARGAPLSVKKKLVKIEKLKQQNQKNMENPVVVDRQITGRIRKEYPQGLENKMVNTRRKLNALEKNVKAKYRKTETYKKLPFKAKGGLIRKPKLAIKGY